MTNQTTPSPSTGPAPQGGHTPGPWSLKFFRGRPDLVVGANGDDVASLYVSDGMDEPKPYPVEANARLIAAAPDMLATLRMIAEFPITDPNNMDAANMQMIARARIAKASTGGASE